MRKITRRARKAFYNNNSFRSGNTKVEVHGDTSELYLHGNLIARKTGNEISFTDAGWQTNTTKERLNGILPIQTGIYQKNHKWYFYNDKKGAGIKIEMTPSQWYKITID